MGSLKIILRFLFNHPLTRRNKVAAIWRFLKWQIASRLVPYPVLHPFVEGSKLLVQKGMAGATGNVYAGLHEFEDMAFMLHLLRPGDTFADVGSNVGAYTVLASAVAGANSVAIEPIPSTFQHLKKNVYVNQVEHLVTLHNVGVGAAPSTMTFTSHADTVNHIVLEGMGDYGATVEVPVKMLDTICSDKVPLLIKMDVEGFELEAMKGATALLRNEGLQAMIVELNATSRRYGVHEKDIHAYIVSFGFTPYSYDPFKRKLEKTESYTSGNTIYARNEQFVSERVASSKKYKVLSYDI